MQKQEVRLLRINEVEYMVGISQSQIWAMCKAGSFPRPRKLSARITVWNSNEVIEFINEVLK